MVLTKDTSKKIQWHPAFCSAMRLELLANKDILDYINEFNLNTKPLQIDLLVIRKRQDIFIQNEIGRLFRGHNITEYKSPDDGLNVDTYYKTLAYACLYKANGEYADSIKAEDITISFIRDTFPRKLMKFFRSNGYEIIKAFPGIYYVKKDGFFDTQVIVSCQLEGESHVWMKSLTDTLQRQNATNLLKNLKTLTGNAEKKYGDSILNVAMQANPLSFDIWKKEDTKMCEALRELMKTEIEEEFRTGIKQALDKQNYDTRIKSSKELISYVENASKNFKATIEEACKALEIPMSDYLTAKDFLSSINEN